jgi:hypothetical protein
MRASATESFESINGSETERGEVERREICFEINIKL